MKNLMLCFYVILLLFVASCTDKSKSLLGIGKQGLSEQKPALSDKATKKLKAWKRKLQRTKRHQLLIKQRAWRKKKWQGHQTQRETLRLRMLEQAQHYQQQLTKVQQSRKKTVPKRTPTE